MIKLDIVGNIKIDETKPVKIQQTLACIKSYEFLKDKCTFLLNTESATPEMYVLVKKTLSECGYQFQLTNYSEPNFGAIYCEMLNDSHADYVINFEADHFLLIDSLDALDNIIEMAKVENVDIIRSSFFKVENRSSEKINDTSGFLTVKIFRMNKENFNLFNHAYLRYFIGTNGIFKRDFALRFWGRKFDSKKPHDWEISSYNQELEYTCMIPTSHYEIQASIEDDHGEKQTCLLSRNEKKFWDVYNSIQLK